MCQVRPKTVFELRAKALYFVQPRSEKILNREQKHRILFSRAAKILESRPQALSCSTAQRKPFGIANKSNVFCSAAQRKFWNCEQKHSIWFIRAEGILDWDQNTVPYLLSCAPKFFEIETKSTVPVLCSAAQRKFRNCQQKHCIWFSCAEKIMEV
jgi:hypothetical protein